MSAIRLRGFFGVASALAMATTLFIAGCSDDDTVKPPNEFAPPSALAFENRSDQVRLSWNLSPDDSGAFDEFAGYNVYRGTAPMGTLSGAELAAKVRNASVLPAGTTTFVDTGNDGPELGTMYYYGVRAVRNNGDVTVSSNEVDTAIFVEGTLATISEFASSASSGFDVSAGEVISVMEANAGVIDFYLGTEDDSETGALQLKSPSLISDQAPWNTRTATFKLLDSDVSSTSTTGFASSIVLGSTAEEIEDKIIAVKLPPNAEGNTHYAKVEVLIFNAGAGSGDRSVRLTWRYQPVPAYPRF